MTDCSEGKCEETTNDNAAGAQRQGMVSGMDSAKWSGLASILLQQLMTYVINNADEIIEALLRLLPEQASLGDHDELSVAVDQFRLHPSEADFNALVQKLEAAGVSTSAITATLLNEVEVRN